MKYKLLWVDFKSFSFYPSQLQGMVDDLRGETEVLREQVGSERTSVKSLESLLQTNREKEFSAQMTLQEYDAEVQLLRDRLNINESKM